MSVLNLIFVIVYNQFISLLILSKISELNRIATQ